MYLLNVLFFSEAQKNIDKTEFSLWLADGSCLFDSGRVTEQGNELGEESLSESVTTHAQICVLT